MAVGYFHRHRMLLLDDVQWAACTSSLAMPLSLDATSAVAPTPDAAAAAAAADGTAHTPRAGSPELRQLAPSPNAGSPPTGFVSPGGTMADPSYKPSAARRWSAGPAPKHRRMGGAPGGSATNDNPAFPKYSYHGRLLSRQRSTATHTPNKQLRSVSRRPPASAGPLMRSPPSAWRRELQFNADLPVGRGRGDTLQDLVKAGERVRAAVAAAQVQLSNVSTACSPGGSPS